MAVSGSGKKAVLPVQEKVLLLRPGGFQFFPIVRNGLKVLFETTQTNWPIDCSAQNGMIIAMENWPKDCISKNGTIIAYKKFSNFFQ
jgi:hypothetical protein